MSPCDATVDALCGPPDAFRPDASHLRDCASCRRLVAAAPLLALKPARTVGQSVALRAALDRDLAPVRYRTPLERAALPVGALAAVSLAGVTLLGRPLSQQALPWVAASAMLAWSALGVGMVLWRGASGLGAPIVARRAYLAVGTALFVGASIATTQELPRTVAPARHLHDHMGVSAVNAVQHAHDTATGPLQNLGACASTSLVFAGVMAFALLLSARRTAPVSSGSLGAVAGASAGLAAAAALQLSCATHLTHALAAHGLPLALATLLCTFVGRRALAP